MLTKKAKSKIHDICARYLIDDKEHMLLRINALREEYPSVIDIGDFVERFSITTDQGERSGYSHTGNQSMIAVLLVILINSGNSQMTGEMSTDIRGKAEVDDLQLLMKTIFGEKLCQDTLDAKGKEHENLYPILVAKEKVQITIFTCEPEELLSRKLDQLRGLDAAALQKDPDARMYFERVMRRVEKGLVCSAYKVGNHWEPNSDLKEWILIGMKLGVLEDYSLQFSNSHSLPFVDKDTYPVQLFKKGQGVRIVPGGTSIRRGAYLARGVVIMPPAYVNVGASVGAGSMIDSHGLVGSCAVIGERVHVSAGSQIGGVLEPIGAVPVVIEDDVMVGGNCGVYEGVVVSRRAVLGTGVILNGSTPVYDLVYDRIIRKTYDTPLVIPENAVVVAGSRKVKGDFAEKYDLAIYTPMIIKYRDDKTDSATALEEALR